MARVNVKNTLSGAVLEVEGDKKSLDYWAALGYEAEKPVKKAATKKSAAKKSSAKK
jgi:hypothetical protein